MPLATTLMAVGIPAETANRLGYEDRVPLDGAGTTQGSATELLPTQTNVAMGTSVGDTAFRLPAEAEFFQEYFLLNTTADAALIYPPVGDTIDAEAVNASVSAPLDTARIIWRVEEGRWVSLSTGVAQEAGIVASVVAGTGISVDNTDPANPIVSNTGVLSVTAGSNVSITGTAQNPVVNADAAPVSSVNGQTGAVNLDAADVGAVATIVAGTNITVDATDPQNPIVSATVPPSGVATIVAGTGIDVDATDPANPIVALEPAEDVRNYLDTGPYVADRTALAALDPTKDTVAWLKESGREGAFQWNAADLSSEVTLDTLQGIYVAPASAPTGASGAWVRQYNDTLLNPLWFGAVGNNVANDSAAYQAAIDLNRGGVAIPPGFIFRLDDDLEVDLDTVKAISIVGSGEEVSKLVYTGTGNAVHLTNMVNPGGDGLGYVIGEFSMEFTTTNQATGIYAELGDVGAGGAQFGRRISNIRFQRAAETGIPQYGLRIRNTTFGTYENIVMFSTGLVGCVVRVEGVTGVDNVFNNIKGVGVDRVWYSDAKAEGYHLFQITGVTTRIGIEWAAEVNTNAKPMLNMVDCYVDATEFGVKVSDAADVLLLGGCLSNVTAGGYGFHYSQDVAAVVGRCIVSGVSFISDAGSWAIDIGASIGNVVIDGNNFTGGTGVKVDATASRVIVGPANIFAGMVADVDNASSTFYRMNANTNWEFNKTLVPETDDGAALGTTAKKWSDAFFATNAVLNFNNGNVTVTHNNNALIFGGTAPTFVFGGTARPAANDGAPLGAGSIAWSDLFLASGGVINWANGDVTASHASNTLAFAGAASGYTFDAGVTIGSATGAAIAAIANAINTTGKTIGKMVWDTTNNRIMVASGTAAASPWYAAGGGTSVTPS